MNPFTSVARIFRGTREKAAVDAMTPADNPGLLSGGGWYGIIREGFSGAFQANVTIDAPAIALQFSGLFAPLTLIAADIAKLGICLRQEDENDIASEADTSPYAAVLKKPNNYQTRIQFIEQWMLAKLLHGNMYALKRRDKRGIVTDLYILDHHKCQPLVTPMGDVYYRLGADYLRDLPEGVTVPASEIIHDRWNCIWHPLVGVSPLYAAAVSATMGSRIQRQSTRFFHNGSRPGGLLTAPGKINPETAARMKEEWHRNYSGDNVGNTAVLGDGLKYESMTIPADQSQLIEQLDWSVKDIAACLHVPLFKVGGPPPPNSSVEAMNLLYYTDCLQSLIEAAELCLDEGLELPNKFCTEFDVENLARMDTPSQIATLSESVKGGWLSPNEARAKRNLAPVAGGNSPYLQQQNFSLEALAKRDALPNPFVIDRPTANPTPSVDGPAPTADPTADPAAKAAEETALLLATFTKELEHV